MKSGRLRRLLGRPMFGTVVIPPDARVDPSAFPEDQFPLWCPGCGYELRGLAHPVCPECGRPFDRGRLLVEEYVLLEHLHRRSRAGRWLYPLLGALLGMLALHFLLMIADPWVGGILPRSDRPGRFRDIFFLVAAVLGLALIPVSVAVSLQVLSRRARQKAVRNIFR